MRIGNITVSLTNRWRAAPTVFLNTRRENLPVKMWFITACSFVVLLTKRQKGLKALEPRVCGKALGWLVITGLEVEGQVCESG
jgi:hypothetical protein